MEGSMVFQMNISADKHKSKRGINITVSGMNKKGSYLVEAAMVFPIFVIATIILFTIVSMFAAAENTVFSVCDQLRLADLEAAFVKEAISLPMATIIRVKGENPGFSHVLVTDYDYLHEADGMKDLISISLSGNYKLLNLIPIPRLNIVTERVRSRAFTGLYNPTSSGDSLSEPDYPDKVYVFPAYGGRYHNRNCSFLNPACQRVFLTDKIKQDFNPCSICGSGEVQVGSSVYCFFTAGEVYHKSGCSMVSKYFEEMERADAVAHGYIPCAACGG